MAKSPAAVKPARLGKTSLGKTSLGKTSPGKTSSAVSSSSDTSAAADRIDAALVREIALLLSETDLSEIEVEKGGLRIRVARQAYVSAAPMLAAVPAPRAAPAAGAPAALAAPLDADHVDVLKSPMVGTAYLRPSPDSKTFTEVGGHVTEGQKVLLIEAMKTFNDIVAHKTGTVTAILVEDSQPVEYGQPLLVIA
jgi:acetyl-CoA carboxylase biotin carboxyl carrier protein